MTEMILPGVYIEEHAEALIVGAPISTGNIGIVGTASRGPVTPGAPGPQDVTILSSFADALQTYGPYDRWKDGNSQELTLVRALEQIYANGTPTVFAVRVSDNNAGSKARPAEFTVTANHKSFTVTARNGPGVGRPQAPTGAPALPVPDGPGTWGNDITINVEQVNPTDSKDNNRRVTISWGAVRELYVVKSGDDLATQINDPTTGSSLVTAPGPVNAPDPVDVGPITGPTTKGTDGADATEYDYKLGLDALMDQDVQIVVAAGRGNPTMRSFLQSHVDDASANEVKRERIAVVGEETAATSAQQFFSSGLDNGRMIYTAPGIQAVDASRPGNDPAGIVVNLTPAYTAAAVAGMISARDPQVSLTHQPLSAPDVTLRFNAGELQQLILHRVLALESRLDVRVTKSITTDSGAFTQITTRRIVDYARNGVRNTAEPFIGLLNNDRVRKALSGAINGFLASMVDAEQLETYDLAVTATRDQEIRGIAVVTMTLQPTFSIDYIQVVMYLQ